MASHAHTKLSPSPSSVGGGPRAPLRPAERLAARLGHLRASCHLWLRLARLFFVTPPAGASAAGVSSMLSTAASATTPTASPPAPLSPSSSASSAVRVPTYRVGALIGHPGARPSAVRATRRPLAGVSVIHWLVVGGRRLPSQARGFCPRLLVSNYEGAPRARARVGVRHIAAARGRGGPSR